MRLGECRSVRVSEGRGVEVKELKVIIGNVVV